jgi:hypothetical protein
VNESVEAMIELQLEGGFMGGGALSSVSPTLKNESLGAFGITER